MKNLLQTALAILLIAIVAAISAIAQQRTPGFVIKESARSDKLTGGKIEKTALTAGDADIKITVNVPAFQLTLWQDGKEVKTYWIGVGMKDYPIYVGSRQASAVIWNPAWIPPDSDWVASHKGVKIGEIIKGGDPRNPIGKLKIPLGDGYLIHQAKSQNDWGSLVSHGCVRMLKPDLYDLAEKIVTARNLPITSEQIARAKASSETLEAKLEPAIPVEITYDTMVIEAGKLHVYPDVYDYNTNTVERLRRELSSNNIDAANITDQTLSKIIERAAAKKQFVVDVESLRQNTALTNGKVVPVVSAISMAAKNSKRPTR